MNSKKTKYRHEFWERLPLRAYLLFILSVFFIFSIFGFAGDLVSNLSFSVPVVILWCIYSGIVGAGYAYSFTRNIKALPFVIIFMLIFIFSPFNNFYSNNIIEGSEWKQIFDGIGIYVSVILGYIFFITFVTLEGIKQIRMRTEMDLAENMHRVLVPPIEFQNNELDVYGLSYPALELGGDLIDLIKNEKYITASIADVSGHGMDAGLLMGMFKTALHLELSEDKSVAEIVNDVNKVLSKLKKQNMFVTCSVIRFHPDNKAEFVTAGHLPILHFQKETQTIKQLLTKQIPVAVKEDFTFTSNSINYSSGDVFILLTDGIIEVMNKAGELFGMDNVEALLLNKNNEYPKAIFDYIFEQANAFGKRADDQSAIVIKTLF